MYKNRRNLCLIIFMNLLFMSGSCSKPNFRNVKIEKVKKILKFHPENPMGYKIVSTNFLFTRYKEKWGFLYEVSYTKSSSVHSDFNFAIYFFVTDLNLNPLFSKPKLISNSKHRLEDSNIFPVENGFGILWYNDQKKPVYSEYNMKKRKLGKPVSFPGFNKHNAIYANKYRINSFSMFYFKKKIFIIDSKRELNLYSLNKKGKKKFILKFNSNPPSLTFPNGYSSNSNPIDNKRYSQLKTAKLFVDSSGYYAVWSEQNSVYNEQTRKLKYKGSLYNYFISHCSPKRKCIKKQLNIPPVKESNPGMSTEFVKTGSGVVVLIKHENTIFSHKVINFKNEKTIQLYKTDPAKHGEISCAGYRNNSWFFYVRRVNDYFYEDRISQNGKIEKVKSYSVTWEIKCHKSICIRKSHDGEIILVD
jgi:hypothetical protein